MKKIILTMCSLRHCALRMLLLLLCCLPLGVKADKVNMPFMYIEKTNGEIIKIPITDNSPTIWYLNEEDSKGKAISYANIVTETETINIPCSEIVRFYTAFEQVEAIDYVDASPEEHPWQVYTLSGLRMASVEDIKTLPRGVYILSNGMKTIKIVNP